MLFENIKKYSISDPGKVALADDKRVINYKQLYQRLKNNQKLLQMYGYTTGTKVILKVQRQLDFVIAILSLFSVECWVIPVPNGITPRELQKVIDLTKAEIFLNHLLEDQRCLDIDGSDDFKKPAGCKTGIYHLTSGTTGIPKLCIRTLDCLIYEGQSFKRTFSISSDDKILSASPLYHSYALGAALITAFVSGGCLYTINNFIPRKVLKIVQANLITILIFVPIMAKALCNTRTEQVFNLSSLRIALVGAGAITKELYDNFFRRYGIALLSNYGSTETGGIISRLDPLPYTSIGRPMDGVKIKLCNDKGERIAPGVVGEIFVKSKGMLKGYYVDEKLSLDKQGFFATGDLAVQDKDNYLYIKGRKKILINIAGKKVNPLEVEEVLLSFPGVKECIVVGSTKKNGEECVKAVIVAQGIKENEIRRFCVNKLSEYKIPSIIEFRQSIPRNNLGKVKREELMKG